MPSAPFTIEPRNKFFEANLAAVESEIRPGNTVTLMGEVDLTRIEALRDRSWEGRRPSYTAVVVKAVALALKEFPFANSRVHRRFLVGPRLQTFHQIDIAVAIERDIPGAKGTAFLDILREADRLSLPEIGEALHALATADVSNNRQWREFSSLIQRFPTWLASWLISLPCLVPRLWAKYRGGAVLISSPAKYGVDAVLGSWMYPIGISFGLVRLRPVVRDGQVVARPTFFLSLNFDRRVMAGAPAAQLFKRIVDILERADLETIPGPSSSPERRDPMGSARRADGLGSETLR